MSWIILIFIMLLVAIDNRDPGKTPRVSVIIPAHNEQETIRNVVKAVKALSYIDEVIVVDDGSTDESGKVAKDAGATVIKHSENKGKGAAIKTGFENSTGDIVAFIDADLSNLTSKKVDRIIKPILEDKVDVSKTKFKRKAGRVTELTAKPLLNFFFPEIKFDQPLSGQFAAKRSFLNRIKFEKDYGVDVGIVLDADVKGTKIKEVDIGKLDHSHSNLKELKTMANEVVRTIVDRAMEYGRVSLIDAIGKYIRMCILGLSMATLGLFSIFFINKIPYWLGIILLLTGIIIAIFYFAKLLKRTFTIISRSDQRFSTMKSFVYMHFPVLVSALILVAMIFSFVGSVNIDDGSISIKPISSNLVWTPAISGLQVDFRGPYTIDSALENEYNVLRVPAKAMNTLKLNYGDSIYINDKKYSIIQTRQGEDNILRIPFNARTFLGLDVGTVIEDSDIRNILKNLYIEKSLPVEGNINNLAITEGGTLKKNEPGRIVNIYVNGKTVATTSGILKDGYYTININGVSQEQIRMDSKNLKNSYYIYWGQYAIKIEVGDEVGSDWEFSNSDQGKFFNIFFH